MYYAGGDHTCRGPGEVEEEQLIEGLAGELETISILTYEAFGLYCFTRFEMRDSIVVHSRKQKR